jgi:hypothetical protein
MKLNEYGNIVVSVDDTSGVGLYASDGSLRVTVVDGSTFTGLYAADGSINVVVVEATDTPISNQHVCGAWRGVATADSEVGIQAPNGAFYMSGLVIPESPTEDAIVWGTSKYLVWDTESYLVWGDA